MKITLCGSTRFMERYREVNAQLSLQGHVVYSVALFEKGGDVLTEQQKITLDLVHLKKIIESDAIVVIGAQEDGTFYIGDSTAREIEWAALNKKMILMERAWHDFEDRLVEIWDQNGGIGNGRDDLLKSCREGYAEQLKLQAAKAKETVQ